MFFANPLFLIALVAVAIPIIVHLFNFRRYRKIYFSNVDYLESLQQQTRRQSNLVRYLILASRILAIVFLVFAFARPMLPAPNKTIKSGGTAVSIYLDNSFSMNNRGADGALLDMAKTKVREIVAAYQPSDQFQLITNQAYGHQFRFLSRDEVLSALDDIEIAPATIALSKMIDKQYNFLHQSTASNLHCYMVSDFQSTTSDIKEFPIDTTIQTTLIPLAGTNVGNLYIDSLSLNAPAYYVGNTVEVKTFLANTSTEPLEQVSVKLYANDKQRAISAVDIPANGTAEVSLRFTIDQAEALNCRVELTDYPITFDDQLYFSINIAHRNPVLTIGNENEFLAKLFSDDSAVVYSTVSEQNINFSTLTQHNLIVLNQLTSIPSGLSQTLSDFVSQGGSLVVIPPQKIDDTYAKACIQWHTPILGSWQKSIVKASSIDFESPLYRNVFSQQTDEMELPQLQGHYLTSFTAGTIATPIISLADGSNYLTATALGNGTIYLFTAPLEDAYTNFVRQALFVPTLYNMALYSRPVGEPYYMLGDATPISLHANYETAHLTSLDGVIDILPDIRQQSGNSLLISHNQIATAGNYRLADDKSSEAISFNYSRQESLMQFLNYSDVEQLIEDNHLSQCNVVRNPEKSLGASFVALVFIGCIIDVIG